MTASSPSTLISPKPTRRPSSPLLLQDQYWRYFTDAYANMAHKEFQELLHALGPPSQVRQRQGPSLQPTDFQDYPPLSPRYTTSGSNNGLQPPYLRRPAKVSILVI